MPHSGLRSSMSRFAPLDEPLHGADQLREILSAWQLDSELLVSELAGRGVEDGVAGTLPKEGSPGRVRRVAEGEDATRPLFAFSTLTPRNAIGDISPTSTAHTAVSSRGGQCYNLCEVGRPRGRRPIYRRREERLPPRSHRPAQPATMCFACKAETPCEHPVSECSAVEGNYCATCQHDSTLAKHERRKSPPTGPKAERPRHVIPPRGPMQRRSRGRRG